MPDTKDWKADLPPAFLEWLNNRRVDDVECIVADIAGMSRGKAMPAKKFARADAMYLPVSIYFQTSYLSLILTRPLPYLGRMM